MNSVAFVWILTMFNDGSSPSAPTHPVVIDNIATKEECLRLIEVYKQRAPDSPRRFQFKSFHCAEVQKRF